MEESIELAVRRAINTMRQNMGEQLTVDDMARAALFSKFHFTRIFQRATGVSPGRFLSALRLQRAKHLLVTTSLKVADISLMVGYNSVGTFSARFSRSVGMPPTVYRQRAGYANRILSAEDGDNQSQARVHGQIRQAGGDEPRPVFVGLFVDRIPQGKPIRCAVLPRAGRFEFDQVPLGTWYLLAQSVSMDDQPAADVTDQHGVFVATHGPIDVREDTVVDIDVDLKPLRTLDPPVLLALMNARKLALTQVAQSRARTELAPSVAAAPNGRPFTSPVAGGRPSRRPLETADRSAA
ncbi:helix-turn-helix domain-containing protein [Micromonospora sp. DT229]|uniref:helix-turn-helix domain-containing protein n=1 Tax=Micromonospora sp. DT229 TaxID=3393430 RepID=UPI003CEEC138